MMQTIQANGYSIFFSETGYEALNQILIEEKYSSIFVIVDSHSNDYCLSKFLPHLSTEIAIAIIEF